MLRFDSEELGPMKRDESLHAAKKRARIDAQPVEQLDEIVRGRVADGRQRRTRSGRRGERPKELDHEPHFGDDPQRPPEVAPAFGLPPRAVENLDGDHGHRGVDRELPLEKSDAQDQPEPGGTVAGEPQQQRVEERLDVPADRAEQDRRAPERRDEEEQARDQRQHADGAPVRARAATRAARPRRYSWPAAAASASSPTRRARERPAPPATPRRRACSSVRRRRAETPSDRSGVSPSGR